MTRRLTAFAIALLVVGVTLLAGGAVATDSIADDQQNNGTVVEPTADSDVVYTSSSDNTVRAAYPENGTTAWTFENHSSTVRDVVVTDDGSRIYSASNDATIREIDPEDGTQVDRIDAHSNPVGALALTDDSETLIAGDRGDPDYENGILRAFDTTNNSERWSVNFGTDVNVEDVKIGPDDQYAYVAADNGIKKIDVSSGSVQWTYSEFRSDVRSVTVGPDGETVYAGSDDATVRALDASAGTEQWAYTRIDQSAVELRTNGDLVYALDTGGNTLHAFGADSGLQRWVFSPSDTSSMLAFSDDQQTLYVGTGGGQITTLDATTGSSEDLFSWHSSSVTGLDQAGTPSDGPNGTVSGTVTDAGGTAIADARVRAYADGDVVASTVTGDDGSYSLPIANGSYTVEATSWSRTDETTVDVTADETTTADLSIDLDGARDDLLYSSSTDNTVRLYGSGGSDQRWTYEGHSGTATDVVVSPDGETVYTASNDNTIREVDAETGRQRDELLAHSNSISDLAMTDDGETLIAGDRGDPDYENGIARAFDTATNSEIWSVNFGTDVNVENIAVGPDDEYVYIAADNGIKKIDVTTGSVQWTYSEFRGDVRSVTVGPDGQTVYAGSDDTTVRAIDASAGTEQWAYTRIDQSAVELRTDGDLVYALDTGGNTLHAFDADSGLQRWVFSPSDTSRTLALSSDQQTLYVGTGEGQVTTLDAATGSTGDLISLGGNDVIGLTQVGTATPPATGTVTGTITDASGSAIADARVRAYANGDVVASAVTGDDGSYSLPIANGSYTVEATSWSRTDETTVDVTADETTTADLSIDLDGARDDLLYSSSTDNTVRLYGSGGSDQRWTYEGHSSTATDVVVSPDGETIYTASNDNTIREVDAETGRQRDELLAHSNPINDLAMTDDGETLIAGDRGDPDYENGIARAFDTATNSEIWSVNFGTDVNVENIAVGPNDEYVYIAADSGIKKIDVTTGSVQWTYSEFRSDVRSVTVGPDGQTVYAGSDDATVRALDASEGTEQWAYTELGGSINELRTDGDLVYALNTGGNTLHAFGADSGLQRWDFEPSDTSRTLALSSNQQTLYVGTGEGQVTTLDAATGSTGELLSLGGNDVIGLTQVGTATPPATGTVAGTITDAGGSAIADARVRAYADGDVVASTVTSDDGSYSLPVASGSYTVEATAWQQQSDTTVDVTTGKTVDASVGLPLSSDTREVLYSGATDNTVRLHNGDGTERSWTNRGHSSTATDVVVSPDGETVYTASNDNTIREVDAETGRQRDELLAHSNPVSDLAMTDDGETLIAGDRGDPDYEGGIARAFDTATNSEIWSVNFGTDVNVENIAVGPDDETAYAVSSDNTLTAVDIGSGTTSWAVDTPNGTPRGVTADDKRVYYGDSAGIVHAVSSDDQTEVWTNRTGGSVSELLADGDRVYALDTGNNRVRALDPASGDALWTFEADGSSSAFALSSDGETLYVGTGGGKVTELDAATGDTLGSFSLHDANMRALASAQTPQFSAAGTFAIQNVAAPTSAEVGDRIEINATVENTANETDENAVELVVDGETVDTTTVELGSGEQRTVTLSYTASIADAGTLGLTVRADQDEKGASVEVEGGRDIHPDLPGYANENGRIDTDALITVISDWQAGETSIDLLRDAVYFWQAGEAVPNA